MMNFNLAELTAAELRWLENNAGEARRNAVKAGFRKVADELRASNLEGMDIHQIAAMTGMSVLQAANAENKEKAAEQMNYNPVQNSYAALWMEYVEVKSSLTLKNVIRRILEYYFIIVCNYFING